MLRALNDMLRASSDMLHASTDMQPRLTYLSDMRPSTGMLRPSTDMLRASTDMLQASTDMQPRLTCSNDMRPSTDMLRASSDMLRASTDTQPWLWAFGPVLPGLYYIGWIEPGALKHLTLVLFCLCRATALKQVLWNMFSKGEGDAALIDIKSTLLHLCPDRDMVSGKQALWDRRG